MAFEETIEKEKEETPMKRKIKKLKKMLESSTAFVEYTGVVDQPKGILIGRGYFKSFAFSSNCIHGRWYFPVGIFHRRYVSFITIETVEESEIGN